MKFIVGADEDRAVVQIIAEHLRSLGHQVELLPVGTWGVVATAVGQAVAGGSADQGVVCCWTGTGVTMAANKVRGVRAALCADAQTASGARKWNDANVLGLSLRTLSEPVAKEILDAWLGGVYSGSEDESLAVLRRSEG